MKYCSKCGNELRDDALFCDKCGIKIENSESEQKKHVIEGTIHKCPNCGAVVDAFVNKCPECEYEFREIDASNSIQEFSKSYANAKNNGQKIDLIRTFVVPNTKEDILEFAILASSNIDITSYSKYSEITNKGVTVQDVSEAWMAKFDQIQQKANILLANDHYLDIITKLYNEKKSELENARSTSSRKKVLGKIFKYSDTKMAMIFRCSSDGILIIDICQK